MMIRWTLAWLGLVPLMIANGVLREATYASLMPALQAHQLSTALGAILVFVYLWLTLPLLRVGLPREAFLLGGYWVLLTVAFEFLFGHYVAGHSWARLARDYNLLEGRLWALLLLWIALAPTLVYRLRPGAF